MKRATNLLIALHAMFWPAVAVGAPNPAEGSPTSGAAPAHGTATQPAHAPAKKRAPKAAGHGPPSSLVVPAPASARPADPARPDPDGTFTIQLQDPDADVPAGAPSGDLQGHGEPVAAPQAAQADTGTATATATEAHAPGETAQKNPGTPRKDPAKGDVETGTPGGPVGEVAGSEKPKPRAKARPRDWKPLTGTGSAPGRHNKWGVVEAVPPALAARARMAFRGDEVEFPEKVHFKYNSIRFDAGAEDVVARIADSLQSSPEIQKLWIEGHTDVSGGESYNQQLSEARASAVREALVRRGVAPERLVAYGFGESRPAVAARSPQAKPENRRVVFRLIQGDRPALQTRRIMEYGQAAVIGVWGPVRWRPGQADPHAAPQQKQNEKAPPEAPATDAREAPSGPVPADAGGWSAVGFRTQLPEGAVVETGEGGRALVRLPDLTRILVEPDTRLALTKIFHSQSEGKSYTSARIETGALWVSANPDERGISTGIWSFPGGSAELTTADFEVRTGADGTSLTVLRGALQASTGGAASIAVAAGERLPAGATAIVPLLAGPELESPLNGAVPEAALIWHPMAGAARYRLEVAEDVTFFQVVRQEETAETRVALAGLEPGRTWYWRVRAMGDDGAPGRSSRLYSFRIEPAPSLSR